MSLADDWGKSFRETCMEIYFESSAKGKPTKSAQAKTTPRAAPPPVVKKPAAVRSKWDGEDEDEDTPVVSLSLIQSVLLRNDSYIRATGRKNLRKNLRRRFKNLLRRRRRKGP